MDSKSDKPTNVGSNEGLGLVARLRQERRPTAWTRGVDTDYPTAWEPNMLAHEAATEIERLKGQHETFGRWIVEALKVLDTIDPDDVEESEQLLALIKAGEMLTLSAPAPKMLDKLRNSRGPVCNLNTPWLAPEA